MWPWGGLFRRHGGSGAKLLSEVVQPASGLRQMHLKTLWLPDLKLESMPDEGDFRADADLRFGHFAQNHPPFRVDFQILAMTKECRGIKIPLLRKRRKPVQKGMDFPQECIASAVQSLLIKGPQHIETLSPIPGEHIAELRWDGDPPFGVKPAGEMRDKSIHSEPRRLPRAGRRPAAQDLGFAKRPTCHMGLFGISWENMGVNGITAAMWIPILSR